MAKLTRAPLKGWELVPSAVRARTTANFTAKAELSHYSGRPLYAIAIATKHRIELDNWDHSAINLPFGRLAIVASEAIYVPRDADNAALEKARQLVESSLNQVTARAYEI